MQKRHIILGLKSYKIYSNINWHDDNPTGVSFLDLMCVHGGILYILINEDTQLLMGLKILANWWIVKTIQRYTQLQVLLFAVSQICYEIW